MTNIEMMKKEYERMSAVFEKHLTGSKDYFDYFLIDCIYHIWSANSRYSDAYSMTILELFPNNDDDENSIRENIKDDDGFDESLFECIDTLLETISKDFNEESNYEVNEFIGNLNAFLCGIASVNGDFTLEESNAVTDILNYIKKTCEKNGFVVKKNAYSIRKKITPAKAASVAVEKDDKEEKLNFTEVTINGNLAPAGAVTTEVISKEPNINGKYAVKVKFSEDYLLGLEITAEYTKEEIESGTLNINFVDDPNLNDTKCETNTTDFSAYQPSDNNTKPVPENTESLEELLEELDGLVGMDNIKKDVHSLMNFIKVSKMRENRGMKVATVSYHLVFTGNPGTGKTTVARLVAKLYHQMGILSKGQLVETDRSSLVGGYLGQTAIKTQEVIQSALGGVLFIDEAYALANGDDQDSYGKEAIETILKAMEDHRDELVVIVAGYTELMHQFIESNPGLKSRFSKYFEFCDYEGPDMLKIFQRFCEQNGYELAEGTEELLLQKFNHMYENRDEHFGNARTVRNMFEKAINNQADRLADIDDVSDKDLMTLTSDDIDVEIE